MYKSALKILAGTAVVALGVGCTTATVDPVPPHSPTIQRIYALDRNLASASRGNPSLPEVLIYSDPANGETVNAPPPSFTRLRVEFDGPVDVSKLLAAPENDILTTGSVSSGAYSFSFCSPKSLTSPGVSLIDVDNATGGNGTGLIEASICYDPTPNGFPCASIGCQVGSAPNVLINVGLGTITPPATYVSPFTCQTFAPASASQPFASRHQYGIKFDPSTITNTTDTSKTLTIPTGTGWATTPNTFIFKTAGFAIMAVGFQNSVNGFFEWIDKPYAGFQKNLPANSPANEKDCDPTAAFAQTGCRVFSDGSPARIVTTQPLLTSHGLVPGVTLTRADGSNIDAVTVPDATGRIARAFPGDTFEPGTSYKLTLDAAAFKDSANEVLDTTPANTTWTFTAGAGPLGLGQTVVVIGSSLSQGQTEVDPGIGGINFQFQLPVDPTTITDSTVTVTEHGGSAVAGTTALDPDNGGNNQSVSWVPTTAPTKFGATYDVTLKGVKVGKGPNADGTGENANGIAQTGQTFPEYDFSFTTLQFSGAGIFDGSSEIDGTRNMRPEDLVNGKLNITFTDAADPSSLTKSTLVLTEPSASAAPTYTVDAAPDGSGATITIDPTTLGTATNPVKFGEQYLLSATTGVKEAGTAKSLHAENCAASDCPDVRGFFTRAFGATMGTPTRSGASAGSFTVTFNYPIDDTTLPSDLSGSFHLIPLTFDAGTRIFTPNSSATVALTCTLNAAKTQIACAPKNGATDIQANTFYRAIANISAVKAKATIDTLDGAGHTITVNLDQTTGQVSTTLTKEFKSPCPP